MKKKITGIAAVLLISAFILSGCSTSLQGLGSTFKLDLENSKLNCKVNAGLLGLETVADELAGRGDLLFDIQLDWKNNNIRCKVDADTVKRGDSHLDFFLNWKSRDAAFVLDSVYPSTEEEKAAGAQDTSSLHFDFLMNWQKKNIDTNLNYGPYEMHIPVSDGPADKGEKAK